MTMFKMDYDSTHAKALGSYQRRAEKVEEIVLGDRVITLTFGFNKENTLIVGGLVSGSKGDIYATEIAIKCVNTSNGEKCPDVEGNTNACKHVLATLEANNIGQYIRKYG